MTGPIPGNGSPVDFPALLYDLLPGVYRNEDRSTALRRFLTIAALPLGELERSIGQLNEDLFVPGAREALIPFIADLVGVQVDRSVPARAQRVETAEALATYRRKGLRHPLERLAEQLTGWRTTVVDFSERVAGTAFLGSLDPVQTVRRGAVGQTTNVVTFHTDREAVQLFDRLTRRPLTRAALDGHETEFAGVEGRFDIRVRDRSVFASGAGDRRVAVTADLTDIAAPMTAAGTPLALDPGEVAVDPVLGRLIFAAPAPLTADITVDYHRLRPEALRRGTLDLRDVATVRGMGTRIDAAARTADMRVARSLRDGIGRHHFDNLGFFFTPGRRVAFRRPAALPPGSTQGRFSFDGRALALADDEGVSIQLQDGLDGGALTRRRLEGREPLFCGDERGFTIRAGHVDVCSAEFPTPLTPHSADLSDFATPRRPDGSPLTLGPTDLAVDPEMGRFLLDLAAVDVDADHLRVDYGLAPVTPVSGAEAVAPDASVPELFTADPQAREPWVDGEDGTPIETKLLLGADPASFHGTERGWRVVRAGADVSQTLPVEILDLGDPAATVTAGHLAVDPRFGRVKFAPDVFVPGTGIVVDYAIGELHGHADTLERLMRRLARHLPAGVVPVPIDTRRHVVDPAVVQ